MNSIHKDLYCTQCELQFDGSFIYGRHLNVVHGKKDFSQSSKNERKWKESIEDDSHGASVVKSDFSKCTFFAQFLPVILKLRKLLVKLYFTRNVQKIH